MILPHTYKLEALMGKAQVKSEPHPPLISQANQSVHFVQLTCVPQQVHVMSYIDLNNSMR